MPPIRSVSVKVNYTTPDCSISRNGTTGDDNKITRGNSSSSAQPVATDLPTVAAPVTMLEKLFDPSNVKLVRLGLAEEQEAVKPPAGSFAYSGVHDDGPLPPPREGGVMAQLISCVQEAKKFNDTYLTDIIEQEKLLLDDKSEATRSKKPKGSNQKS